MGINFESLTLTLKRYNVKVPSGVYMEISPKRATIYLDPDLHKALKLKAAETSSSISDLVNRAIQNTLSEDNEDLAAFRTRAREPLVTFEDFIQKLKKDGQI